MNSLLYVLIVICTHGQDNKQLLAEVAVHATMERCQVTQATVQRNMENSCNQIATNCVPRELVK